MNKCHSYPDDNIIICENRIIIMIKKNSVPEAIVRRTSKANERPEKN